MLYKYPKPFQPITRSISLIYHLRLASAGWNAVSAVSLVRAIKSLKELLIHMRVLSLQLDRLQDPECEVFAAKYLACRRGYA